MYKCDWLQMRLHNPVWNDISRVFEWECASNGEKTHRWLLYSTCVYKNPTDNGKFVVRIFYCISLLNHLAETVANTEQHRHTESAVSWAHLLCVHNLNNTDHREINWPFFVSTRNCTLLLYHARRLPSFLSFILLYATWIQDNWNSRMTRTNESNNE